MFIAKRFILLCALVALVLPARQLLAANVYKVVDEDGNVTYTDQPPDPGAKPVDLPGLSIVERPEYQENARTPSQDNSEANEQNSMRDLQRMYRQFQIVSPTPEQSLWGTANTASIAWDAGAPLQPGMRVKVMLDGEAMEPTTSSVINTGRLDRGEHQVSAVLIDADGNSVMQAQPVTFFIKQQIQRPVRQPRAGG